MKVRRVAQCSRPHIFPRLLCLAVLLVFAQSSQAFAEPLTGIDNCPDCASDLGDAQVVNFYEKLSPAASPSITGPDGSGVDYDTTAAGWVQTFERLPQGILGETAGAEIVQGGGAVGLLPALSDLNVVVDLGVANIEVWQEVAGQLGQLVYGTYVPMGPPATFFPYPKARWFPKGQVLNVVAAYPSTQTIQWTIALSRVASAMGLEHLQPRHPRTRPPPTAITFRWRRIGRRDGITTTGCRESCAAGPAVRRTRNRRTGTLRPTRRPDASAYAPSFQTGRRSLVRGTRLHARPDPQSFRHCPAT